MKGTLVTPAALDAIACTALVDALENDIEMIVELAAEFHEPDPELEAELGVERGPEWAVLDVDYEELRERLRYRIGDVCVYLMGQAKEGIREIADVLTQDNPLSGATINVGLAGAPPVPWPPHAPPRGPEQPYHRANAALGTPELVKAISQALKKGEIYEPANEAMIFEAIGRMFWAYRHVVRLLDDRNQIMEAVGRVREVAGELYDNIDFMTLCADPTLDPGKLADELAEDSGHNEPDSGQTPRGSGQTSPLN